MIQTLMATVIAIIVASPSGVLTVIGEAQAGETSEERTYRDHYYPGTEQLPYPFDFHFF